MKNRYLNLSAVLKFATSQYEPKRAEMKYCEPRTSNNDSRAIFSSHVHNQTCFDNHFIYRRRFAWNFEVWISLFKYLQEFKVNNQKRELERLIFDYT